MNDDLSSSRWRRTLWAMVVLQFVIGMAFSIAPPIIALVLPTLGVTGAASVRSWAGVLLGVTPLAAALTSPLWGRVADHMDRRIILLIACGSAAACTAAMSLVINPWQLLALRFAMGLFGGHIAAGMSIVSGAAPPGRLGWALGWLATGQLGGSLLGPLIGGGVADFFADYRAAFLSAGLAALLVCSVIAVVPGAKGSAAWRPQREAQPGLLTRYKTLFAFVVVLLLAQCAIMGPQPIVSLRVRELVGVRADLATLAGFAFSVVGMSGLIAAPLIGRLSDAVGARKLLLAIVICAALFTTAQGYAPTYKWFLAARFCAGLFLFSIIPLVNSLVGKTVSEQDRGRAFGLTAGAAFLGAFLGPVSGGLLGAESGLKAVFLASGAVLLTTALLIGLRMKQQQEERHS
jgi:DHA1 family multidrug resistance protein-like MFS transporter